MVFQALSSRGILRYHSADSDTGRPACKWWSYPNLPAVVIASIKVLGSDPDLDWGPDYRRRRMLERGVSDPAGIVPHSARSDHGTDVEPGTRSAQVKHAQSHL